MGGGGFMTGGGRAESLMRWEMLDALVFRWGTRSSTGGGHAHLHLLVFRWKGDVAQVGEQHGCCRLALASERMKAGRIRVRMADAVV